MITYLSFLSYLALFLFGFYLDRNGTIKGYLKEKDFYLLILCVFLSFGYMTGGDWRGYELYYNDFHLYEWKFVSEPASYFVFSFFPKLISDYWLFSGVVKCFYFYSLLTLFKRTTIFYVASIACLMQISLVFMLIGNPFRFMMALIPINYALCLYLDIIDGKNVARGALKIFVLLLLAALFHNSCSIFLLLFIGVWFYNDITKVNRVILLLIFFVCVIVTSDTNFINSIKDYFNSLLFIFGDVRDYSVDYSAEDTSSLLSTGNLLQILFFVFVLSTRDKIVANYKRASFVYTMTVYYFLIDRVLLLIPTGFRIAIPFGYFYAIYVIYMMKQYKRIGLIVFSYLTLQFSMIVWNDFSMIPYSNSIPYIIGGHLPFDYRYNYNFNECIERTGVDYSFK